LPRPALRVGLGLLGCCLAWASPVVAGGSSTPTRVEDCDSVPRQRRTQLYDCLVDVARRHQKVEEALRRLNAIVEWDAQDAEAYLALSKVARRAGMDEKGDYARTAARLFAEQHQTSRQNTAEFLVAGALTGNGRNDESDRLLDQIEQRLKRPPGTVEERDQMVELYLDRYENAFQRGEYARVLVLVREAEGFLGEQSSVYLRARVESGLGKAMSRMQHDEDALAHFQRAMDLMAHYGDAYYAAQFGLHLLKQAVGTRPREELERLRDDVVLLAENGQNHLVEAEARWMLLEPGAPGYLQDVEKVIDVAKRYSLKRLYYGAVRARAKALVAASPSALPEAERQLDEITEAARSTHSLYEVALTAVARARVSEFAHLPWERVASDWTKAFEAIEDLRRSQPEPTASARVMGQWASAYYFVSSQWAERGTVHDANQAFATIERLRGYALVDALLRRTGAGQAKPSGAEAEGKRIRQEIASIRSRLMAGTLGETERTSARHELERLEAEEAALPASPVLAEARPPHFADVQRVLGGDQALISYQLADPRTNTATEAGGVSWAFIIWRGGAAAVALPQRSVVQGLVSSYLGSLASGAPPAAAQPLFEAILKPALAHLPSGIRRLVIVPDDALHRLPFDSLGEAPGAPLLASHLDVSLTPSVTAWLWWKSEETRRVGGPVLALANPAGVPGGPGATRGGPSWIEGLHLAALPRAGEEATSVARIVGGASEAVVGGGANAAMLKHADLSRYALLHFAAHAVTDEAQSDRSAIVLAGGPGDDGLLDVRDIQKLMLQGKVIVLSACGSATGSDVRGEGPLGLTRAFLDAGASAVVSTLRPLGDAEAAEMMPALYRRLKDGLSLGEAVAATRREWMGRSDRPMSWANLVVVGDADVVLFPRDRRFLLAALGASGLAACAAAALALARRRRRRPSPTGESVG
jgi:CHAT domain-containing protein/tetratricopeptide (TPR) repeat protein